MLLNAMHLRDPATRDARLMLLNAVHLRDPAPTLCCLQLQWLRTDGLQPYQVAFETAYSCPISTQVLCRVCTWS